MRAVFALTAALVLTGAASATPNSVEIPYTQRDLIDPARVELLQDRIERAAEQVCGVRQARGLRMRADAQRCVRDAEERATAQLARAVARAGGSVVVAVR